MNAEDTNATVATSPEGATPETATEQVENETYTKEDVARLLQAETDRRVTSALAKQRKEYEQKLSLAKLDGVERERAEAANTIADLQAQLAEFKTKERKADVKTVFAAHGLPVQLVDHINISEDNEANQAMIEELDSLWKAAIADEVKKKFSSGKVNVGTTPVDTPDPKKMTLAEKQKLYAEDPQKYNAMYGK